MIGSLLYCTPCSKAKYNNTQPPTTVCRGQKDSTPSTALGATYVELGAAALEAVGLVHDQHVPVHLAAQQRHDVLTDAQLRRRHHHRRLPQTLALRLLCRAGERREENTQSNHAHKP